MKKATVLAFIGCAVLAGCAPANLTSVSWDSGANSGNVQTRCEQVDMRSNSNMEKIFSKYDGWKMVYISEYTTQNRIGTDAAVCFERVK
ncbi:MAG: hypothetical protein AB1499_16575 [Nitrospirota bacterium]